MLCGSKAEAPKESCCPKTSPGADDETYYTGTYMVVGWYACLRFVRNCPAGSIVSGGGKAPLQPIPVQRPFQIIGVDVMDLIKTGNSHVVVFQDYLSKWPIVFAVLDQKSVTLVRLLVEEVIPFFGVLEPLLSDCGTNLLSFLVKDICQLLGAKHDGLQCDCVGRLGTNNFHHLGYLNWQE